MQFIRRAQDSTCCACLQAELQKVQRQLAGAEEARMREAAQLQAQLRQLRSAAERGAQELEGAREELARAREKLDSERQRLAARHDGLLKVLADCSAKGLPRQRTLHP